MAEKQVCMKRNHPTLKNFHSRSKSDYRNKERKENEPINVRYPPSHDP